MELRHTARETAEFAGVTLAIVVLSPAVVLVGEPLRRGLVHRMMPRGLACYGPGTRPAAAIAGLGGPGRLAAHLVSNPVLIALTAPGRWVTDRAWTRPGPRGPRGPGPWDPPAGVREPRRPSPAPQGGSTALAEPR